MFGFSYKRVLGKKISPWINTNANKGDPHDQPVQTFWFQLFLQLGEYHSVCQLYLWIDEVYYQWIR